ncbi:MAG TPA: hypothetical protein PK375_02380 [Rhodocyclaceae bacterium]|nr:hypothetical protein [Rhodocyclaceae bacterium]HNH34729.1 hypothetical protein [Rhodocyclaceae bacterium]
MIRIEECEALFERRPDWVSEMACRDCLTLVPAYADPHEAQVCADHFAGVPEFAAAGARPHAKPMS